jgi:hypothetical protein
MAAADTGSAIVSGGAAIVGALVGGGIGWLATWTTARRSRKQAREDRQRNAYVVFIAAADELTRLMKGGPPTGDPLTVTPELRTILAAIERAYAAVTLAGPQDASRAAENVRTKAWEIFHWWRRHNKDKYNRAELATEVNIYIGLCEIFTKAARDTLGN